MISSSYIFVPAETRENLSIFFSLSNSMLDLNPENLSRRFRARESNYASDEQSEAHVEIG